MSVVKKIFGQSLQNFLAGDMALLALLDLTEKLLR
jgi:hypothetical protein